MTLTKKFGRFAVILLCCLFLSSCFHLRKPTDLPKNLHRLYFTSDNVNSNIVTKFKRMLKASGVQFTTNKTDAPLILILSNSHTHVKLPIIFNSLAASSYTYKISTRMQLVTQTQHVILDTEVMASESVTHSVNQIDTPFITPLMRRTLTRRLVNSMYDILISVEIQKSITKFKRTAIPAEHNR